MIKATLLLERLAKDKEEREKHFWIR